jgi:hypothetical protein
MNAVEPGAATSRVPGSSASQALEAQLIAVRIVGGSAHFGCMRMPESMRTDSPLM